MMKNVVEFDPKTGKTKQNADLGLTRSYQIDESGTDQYIYTVKVDGHPVYCNPIGEGAMDALAQADTAFQSELKGVAEAQRENTITPDEAKSRSFAAVGARRDAYVAAIQPPVLVGWELPGKNGLLPCTPETIAKLPTDVIISLVTQIQQKQSLGQTEADFLDKRS